LEQLLQAFYGVDAPAFVADLLQHLPTTLVRLRGSSIKVISAHSKAAFMSQVKMLELIFK
jgi:hypothetical protein